MIDPLNDKSFADELRKSDRLVSVKPFEITDRLMAHRRRNKRNRVLLVIAIPVGLLLVGFATNWAMSLPSLAPISGSIAQSTTNETEAVVEEVVEKVVGEVEDSPLRLLAASLKNRDLLAAQEAKLRRVQREIDSLKRLRSQQQWALSRELVSRTEVDQAMGRYKF